MHFPHFSIEDLVDIEHPSDVQMSPSGDWVAFVRGKANKADKDASFERTIYLVETATGNQHVLTGGEGSSSDQPRWSPDGSKIAFVSNRADHEETQLYIIDPKGGEARALTHLHGQIEEPRWSSDGCSIAFLYNGALEKHPDPDPIVVDADPLFNRVWILDTETNDLRAVTAADYHVFEYDWSPDDKTLVVLTSPIPTPNEGWYSAQLYTVDLAQTGAAQQLCALDHQIGRLNWSPDGAAVAFVYGVMSDQGNISGEVYVVLRTGGEPHNLTPGVDFSITWIEWRDEGILFGARQVDSTVFGWIDPQIGARRVISKGAYSVNGWGAQRVSASRRKTFAALRESFIEPPNVYVGSLDGGTWQRLTDLPLDPVKLPPLRVENRYWKGADGLPMHGFLIYPPDYEPGKRYPLFNHVHGGPSWGYVPRYVSPWERMLTARGCFIFLPNPRGSWGYGHAFQSANVGDLGGGDWNDIEAGVDSLIDAGLVDPDRMAIGGWSYGGYLVAWAVTQTTRYRCAFAGASITNYESNYGLVSNREWQTTMFGSNVYDDFDLHRSRSPIAFASRVKTPTLIVHGDRDPYAPFEQAVEFYIALKHFGAPAQLVIYPREPHGFQERAHQIDLNQRIVGWVDKYLFGE